MTSALQTCQTSLAAANAQITTLKQQLASANAQITTLTQQRDSYKDQLATVTAERDALSDQLGIVTAERDALSVQVASLNDTVTSLQAQIVTLNDTVASLQQEIATLTAGTPTVPTITNFVATPASLPAGGGSVVLSATIGGSPAPALTLDGAPIAGLPFTVANIAQSHAFSLSAANSAGSVSASAAVSVAVVAPPPSATSVLSDLAAGKCRVLGQYADPDPVWTQYFADTWDSAHHQTSPVNITDDSGVIELEPGVIGVIRGGGHGPGVQSNPRAVDVRGSAGAAAKFVNLCPSVPFDEMTEAYLVANPSAIDIEYGAYRDITTGAIRGPTPGHSWRGNVARGRDVICTQWRGLPDWIVPSQKYWGGRIFRFNLDTKAYTFSAIAQTAIPWDQSSAAVLDPQDGKILVVGPVQTQHALPVGSPGANLWLYDPDADTITYGPALSGANFPGAVLDCVRYAGAFYAIQRDGSVWQITRNVADFTRSACVPIATTGTKPAYTGLYNVGVAGPIGSKIYGLMSDAAANAGGNTVAACGTLYVLDLATMVWSTETIAMEDAGVAYLPGQSDACIALDSLSNCLVLFWNPPYGLNDSNGVRVQPCAYAYRPLGASNPDAPPPSTTVDASPFVVTLDFGNGDLATFDGAKALDKGDFVGEFVRQKNYLASDATHPDWRVWIRPDADGKRDEVVVEYGRATAGTPANRLTAYVATITKAGKVVATQSVPQHFWYSRWRWQSSRRPVVRDVATLRTRKWIPNFGTAGMYGASGALYRVTWPGPMGTPARPTPDYPFPPIMGEGGDHEELGFLTEAAATYAINGGADALETVYTDGEWTGNWPIHVRNDDGSMLAVRDTTTFWKSSPGTINNPVGDAQTSLAYPNYVCCFDQRAFDGSHWYASALMPWLLTDDPFYLEALQFGYTFRQLVNRERITTKLGGVVSTIQTRGFAWGIRDIAILAATTPASVPASLAPQSHWKGCLDDMRDLSLRYVADPSPLRSIFRCWTRVDLNASWMNDWLSTACGRAVELGFADWAPIFSWSVAQQIAMTDGKSGWNRQWPSPFGWDPCKTVPYPVSWDRLPPTPVVNNVCASWDEAWVWYKNGQQGTSDNDGHVLDDSTWDGHTLMADLTYYPGFGYSSYFLHCRAALAQAVRLGVVGAQACYDYLHGEMTTKLPQTFKVGGQARFSIDP